MNRLTLCIAVCFIFALPVFSSGEGISEISNSGSPAETIPVTRVTLYTAGLAHMVHESTVFDDEIVLFPVEPKDINDVLKSLVIEDLDGGTVETVNFDSSDPLNVILGDMRVNPAGSPPLYDFLLGAQGEWITAVNDDTELEGRVFSVERKQTDEGIRLMLNLLNSGGINTIDISEDTRLSFSDPMLQNELNTALEKISASRLKSVRTLKISFRGSGERRIRISYIRAVPLWKTSYRIVLDEDGVPRLEGWAIVQNTGSTAWNNVRIGFVAGMPNAFTMDLSTPRYVTRENVSSAAQKPIGPTSYEKAYSPAPSAARSQIYDAPSMAPSAEGLGYGGFDEVMDYESEAYTPPPVAAGATAVSAGNFYRYDVNTPITIDARSSAMIPIIQHARAGRTVGVYDPSYNLVFKGIILENGSGAQWAAGPATVLEGRYFGGDVLLPEMLPGSERLLTYAVHGSLEVEKSIETAERRITALKITDGVLHRTEKMERKSLYRIAGDEDELLIIHPKDSGWNLVESPEVSAETNSEYRFVLKNREKSAPVTEEYIIFNQYSLLNLNISDLDYYIEWNGISAEMKRAFKRIAELKSDLEAVRTEINTLNGQINRIVRDQSRIRENMKVLDKESSLFKQYSQQLESQEKEIAELYSLQAVKQTELQNADRRLKDYIAALDIE